MMAPGLKGIVGQRPPERARAHNEKGNLLVTKPTVSSLILSVFSKVR
jgi:hypothetical protein